MHLNLRAQTVSCKPIQTVSFSVSHNSLTLVGVPKFKMYSIRVFFREFFSYIYTYYKHQYWKQNKVLYIYFLQSSISNWNHILFFCFFLPLLASQMAQVEHVIRYYVRQEFLLTFYSQFSLLNFLLCVYSTLIPVYCFLLPVIWNKQWQQLLDSCRWTCILHAMLLILLLQQFPSIFSHFLQLLF